MKKLIIQSAFSLIFIFGIFSCEDEPVDAAINNSIVATTNELTSIHWNLRSFGYSNGTYYAYPEGNLEASVTYLINNGEVYQELWDYGGYYDNTYQDGKLSMDERYDEFGTLTSYRTYEYDTNDRLIQYQWFDVENGNEFLEGVLNIEYAGDQITRHYIDFEGSTGNIISEYSYYLTLDSNNEIVRFENEDASFISELVYEDGDLISYISPTGSGTNYAPPLHVTFEHTNQLNTSNILLEYLFGPEWKNNSILLDGGTYIYYFKQLSLWSKHNLVGFSCYSDEDGHLMWSSDVNYSYDAQGNLIEMDEDRWTSGDAPFRRQEFFYNYE